MPKKTKAYYASVKNGDGSIVILFSETPGKARALAMSTDMCEDALFTEIEIRRAPAFDDSYRGHPVMDWYDSNDRIDLVKKASFVCEPGFEEDCDRCPARDFCDYCVERKEHNDN